MNDSSETLEANVTIMSDELKLANSEIVEDLISGESIKLVSNGNIKLTVKMAPEQVRLLSFKKN